MAAESLGELVYTIEAENAQFKAKLKESESLVKNAATGMAAANKKVTASADKTALAFGVLSKTASATGSTFIASTVAVLDLGLALNQGKQALQANTVATGANATTTALAGASTSLLSKTMFANTAAFIKNTAAASANTVARLALLVVTNPVAAAIALVAVAAVTATAATILHTKAQNKNAESLKEINKRNKEKLALLKNLKVEEAANVKAIQKQSFIARQGLKGNRLELFNAQGNEEFGGIKNKAVREETIRHIKLKMRLEKDAFHARQLVAQEEKRIAEFKADQAKAAKVLADEETRRAAQLAGRRQDASDRNPTNLFNRARFERTQGQVKSQALLQGLIQALKRGANAAGIAGLAGITGNEGIGGGRAAGSTTLNAIGASLSRSGGSLGTKDSELKKQTKLAVDANRLLKALVKKRNATVIGA